MGQSRNGLDALTRQQRGALRDLLIATVARAGSTDGRPDLTRLVAAAPIDCLPEAAALHRLTGTVLRGLDGVDGVPDDVRAALARRRAGASVQHLLIVGALSEAARRFDEAGLAWVAMKGPVVASLYPDAGDRSYADLDLLVVRRDFPRAMSILEDLGYAPTVRNWALAEVMLAGEVEMSGPAALIDLHWALHYSREARRPFGFVPEEMVARARRVSAAGVVVPTLDAEDTLITLAFHAARSDGHRLLWLKDIERAVDVGHPDFDEVVRRARSYRCAPSVGLLLGRARTILGADVPADVISALTPASLRAVDRVSSRLVNPVQLHDHDTVTRSMTRSVRSSIGTSLLGIPERFARSLLRKARPPAENESDDPVERASYLAAVSSSRPSQGPA